jgi:DNA-directed RNA polymerase subunit beta'
MSAEERHEEVVKIWERATDHVAQAMEEYLFRLNPIFMMANSGARGSFKQIRQLAGMRGCMNNPKGETIERPIKSNFMEGLSVLEYFISTHGARKGLADTALKTADSGYLTRRLVDVAQDVIVREHNCGTGEGIEVSIFRDGSFNQSVPGRVLIGPIIDVATGEVVYDPREEAPELALAADTERQEGAPSEGESPGLLITNALSAEIERVCLESGRELRHLKAQVRSPLKCRAGSGLCTVCYGSSPATGRLTEIGDAVGIIAAQSIGEPGTQLTMRTFHTGGVAGADITHGLPRVVELFEARKPKALALVAPADGWIRIDDDESRPGGASLVLTEPEYMPVEDAGTGEVRQAVREHVYPVPKRTQIVVKDGDWVEAGTMLTIGSAFPADILDSSSGIAIDVEGTISRIKDEKDGWVRTDLKTADGKVVRHLRLPEGRVRQALRKTAYVGGGVRLLPDDVRGERSTKTELYLVGEVQNVYRSQGVDINDKHIEVIVRQMLKKVKVMESGATHFLPGQMVDKPVLYRENARAALNERERLLAERESDKFTGSDADIDVAMEAAQATFEPLILGITKASLATESFLSAASFQETTKVLTDAALEGKVDHLRGLKENVIIGKLIPAATGLRRYRNLDIEAVRRAPALLEFDLDEPFSSADDFDGDDILGLVDEGGTFSFEPEFDPEPEPEPAE